MSLRRYGNSLVIFVTIVFASHTIYRYITNTLRKKKKTNPKEINDVLIFSEATELIESRYSSLRSLVHPSTERVLYYINQSRYTLDICMYMLTNKDIAYMIQRLHFRGVRIRFIVDADTAYVGGSETKRLSRHDAIVLRWKKSDKNIMHHKFCLIDASTKIQDRKVIPFVMTGSLNWTNPALTGNWESVVVMSEPRIVQGYKEEFERLWFSFEPPRPFL